MRGVIRRTSIRTKGLSMGVLSTIGTAVGGMLAQRFLPGLLGVSRQSAGSAGSAVGGALGNLASGAIPSMRPGYVSGRAARRFMNEAYPGTSPYERLGANAGSSVGSATARLKHEKDMQEKDLASKERIARMQTNANIWSSGVSAGHGAVGLTQIMRGYRSGMLGDFENRVDQMRRQLEAQVPLYNAQTLYTKAQKAYTKSQTIGVNFENELFKDIFSDPTWRRAAGISKAVPSAANVVWHLLNAIDAAGGSAARESEGFSDRVKKEFQKRMDIGKDNVGAVVDLGISILGGRRDKPYGDRRRGVPVPMPKPSHRGRSQGPVRVYDY